MEYIKRNSVFSFLYTSSKNKDMNEIYESIKNNKIDCDNEFLEKCQTIKDIILNKINNGMTYESYVTYKDAIKKLDPNVYYIYIDNLINILSLDESYLNHIVNYELENNNYNCLKCNRNNENINISHISSIDILNEIHSYMKSFVSNYVKELTKDYPKEYIVDFYNKVLEFKDYYITAINKDFINEFSYLENTIYESLYFNFLNDLPNVFKSYLKSIYRNSVKDRLERDTYKFYNPPRHHSQGYGYFKKYKDYKR